MRASIAGAYEGLRACCVTVVTRPDGSPLPLQPSLLVRQHSPTGFEWGYMGSGPSQLALALLLDATGSAERSARLYQHFKMAYVAGWGDRWELPVAALDAWIKEAEA